MHVNGNRWSWLLGLAMVVVGLTLYLVYRDTETPVLGLRQTGAVLAVLGVVELAVAGWSTVRARRVRD